MKLFKHKRQLFLSAILILLAAAGCTKAKSLDEVLADADRVLNFKTIPDNRENFKSYLDAAVNSAKNSGSDELAAELMAIRDAKNKQSDPRNTHMSSLRWLRPVVVFSCSAA